MELIPEITFFRKLKSDHLFDFPNLIDLSNYNRRRKMMANNISRLNQVIASILNEGENVFIGDSIPVPLFVKLLEPEEVKYVEKILKQRQIRDIPL